MLAKGLGWQRINFRSLYVCAIAIRDYEKEKKIYVSIKYVCYTKVSDSFLILQKHRKYTFFFFNK
jgi:hypothetical protein